MVKRQSPMQSIIKKRKAAGLSQWDLANLVGRSGPWLGLRERGNVYPTPGEVRALEFAIANFKKEAGRAR